MFWCSLYGPICGTGHVGDRPGGMEELERSCPYALTPCMMAGLSNTPWTCWHPSTITFIIHLCPPRPCTIIIRWATDKLQCWPLRASSLVRQSARGARESTLIGRIMRAFTGVLFICLNVDYKILFHPLTDEVLNDGFEFYTTFFKSPPAIKVRATLHFHGRALMI
jgi:hypothetical protein